MAGLRFLLVGIFLGITAYTAVTISNHGWDLMPVFFGDIAKMAWPGQFNFDFMCFLTLSAVGTAWRNHFTLVGLGLGLVAFLGGAMLLSLYLLVLSLTTGGDIKAMMMGTARAQA